MSKIIQLRWPFFLLLRLVGLALYASFNAVSKKFWGSIIMLTSNEIRYIMKVIRSLENRGILLKEPLEKLVFKKEDISIFLDH